MPAIGLTLGAIKGLVRSHAWLSPTPGLNLQITQQMVDVINSTQRTLYLDHDWPGKWREHKKALAATQRYYDFPTTLDFTHIGRVKVRWAEASYRDVDRGISAAEYAAVDSESAQTRDYVQKWDYRVADDKTPQFEVWPIPVSNDQTLYMWGMTKLSTLVADSDISELDGTLIALFAAASLLKGEATKEGKAKLREANAYFSSLKKRENYGGGAVGGVMGGGPRHGEAGNRKVRILVARS